MLNSLQCNTATIIAYYLTLLAFLIASFFPEYRIWGINWWAYYPIWVPIGLFTLGAVTPIALRFLIRREETSVTSDKTTNNYDRSYWLFTAGLTTVFGLLFYFLRTRTHFLGDSYTLLAILTNQPTLAIKTRAIGEALAHTWLMAIIGGGYQAALLSCQIISIGSGLIFLIAVTAFARSLFERIYDRVLFALGICTGGYMLLYFGYAEYYSLFVLSVMVYTLTGLVVLQGEMNRWLVLLPLGASIFFHIFGIALIPSAIYLLFQRSKAGHMISRWSRATQTLVMMTITFITAVVFYHFYTTSYFFRFSFVPLVENRFTVEGYTLFSFKHLADILNQLVLLLPGLCVLVVSVFSASLRNLIKRREVRYLLVLVLSTLGIVFIFDPRLGMPRDWDLFSFIGVPLSVACYYIILSSRTALRTNYKIIIMAIICGLLLLIPRAVAMIVPDVAITHFQQYRNLDSAKNKNAGALLREFYIQQEDSTKAEEVEMKWMALFPQHKMLDEAKVLSNQGKYREAVDILHKTVEIDPLYWNAWVTLGKCHYYLRQFDSALYYLDISLGFNPDAASAFNNKGAVLFQTRDFAQAESMFLKSLEIDTAQIEALSGLTNLYRTLRRENEYVHYLLRLTSKEHAPMVFVKELGDFMVSRHRFQHAAQAYHRALAKGLDSSHVIETIRKHPELQNYFR